MAVGNFTLYNNAKLLLAQAALNLSASNANIFAVLATNTYAPAVTTDTTYANVSTNEATGTGYTAGGLVLTSTTLAQASGTVTFSSGAVTWSASTITARYFVLIRRATAGTATSTDPLIGFVDLVGSSGSVSSTSGAFTVTPSGSGWFTLT
jgi:hypothetical protein